MQNIDERKKSGLTQKMFLVKMEYIDKSDELLFHVLGNSSHVYKIKYNTKFYYPKCSCPDSTFRKVTCKHIHFLSNKVLGKYYNTKFTPESLFEFYNKTKQKLPHLSFYSKDIENQYNQVLDESNDILDKPRNKDCCICIEDFTDLELKDIKQFIIICKVCLNGIHKICYDKWKKFSKNATCTSCRAKKQQLENEKFTDCVGNLKI